MDLKESNNNTGTRHPWESSRVTITTRLMPDAKTTKSFLDLGSGDLYFSKQLCQLNHQTKGYAVDIAFSEKLINEINNNTRNISAYNSLDALQKEIKESVSVVFLMDVLEHIENDKEFLLELLKRPFITKNTTFYITVPAFQSLYCSHDKFLEHHRRYNNRQLKKLLTESGLTVKKTGYFYSSLILPRMLKVMKEKIANTPSPEYSDLNHWNKGKFITSLVKNTLLIDFHISNLLKKIGIKLPGLSSYAICQISV